MSSNYQSIINKIDKYIRKYYINLVLKGALLSAMVLLLSYLILVTLEYFGHFSIQSRTILFYTALGFVLLIFYKTMLIPLVWFSGFGKRMNRKQAAQLIAKKFPTIKDKLLNVLELKEIDSGTSMSQELLLASIEQKTLELKPFAFITAVDIKPNIKLLKYFGGISAVFLVILLFSPALITEGTERIIHHRKHFEEPAPFQFLLQNDTMLIERGDDFTVDVQLQGDYIPQNVYINFGGNEFLMNGKSINSFQYLFKNLNNSVRFFFQSEQVRSKDYYLDVFPSPSIIKFLVTIDVPEYTLEEDRIMDNIGDLTVPNGSKVTWEIKTQNIDSLKFVLGDKQLSSTSTSSDLFNISAKLSESNYYTLSAQNQFVNKDEILKYFVNVIPDLYPDINVSVYQDSLKPFIYYFNGKLADDYGFTKLRFSYQIDEQEDTSIVIPLSTSMQDQDFYYAYDFSKLHTNDQEKIEYFFEVWDNDEVNGYKSSRSNLFVYSIPNKKEIEELQTKSQEKIESLVEESQKVAEKLQKEITEMKERNIKEELSSWEKSQMVESVLEKQKSLEEMLKQLADENQLKNEIENSLSEEEQEILDKQEQIQDLLEKLLDDELKQLLEELKDLQESMDEKKIDELSEDLELSYEDLAEQLERNLEMLKQYELEKDLNEVADELEDLAKDQEELAKDTEQKEKSKDELMKEQEKQKEALKDIEEKFKEAQEKNGDMKNPMDMDDMNEDFELGEQNFDQDMENLEEGKNSKASKGMKKNAQKMQEMAKSLQSMMKKNQSQQSSENLDDLQQIIENLVSFSFDEESILLDAASINRNDPMVKEIINRQNKANDDFVIIKDSLNALAMRVPQMGTGINKEILKIQKKAKRVDKHLEDLNLRATSTEQQFIMTSANNLALLLAEAKKQMQEQMSMQMQGEQQCQKPGQGMPMMQDLKQMQQGMKQQIQGMMDQMKKGEGKGSKQDKNAMNKRLAEMMAQQEMFSQMMKKMGQKGGIKPETQKILNEINKLVDENEKDLLNKNITPQLLNRQQLILTRLLEAEKAENEREIEKKRQSKENKEELLSNPEKYFEYNELKNNFKELFEYQNLKLNNYYNKRYKDYLLKLNNEN